MSIPARIINLVQKIAYSLVIVSIIAFANPSIVKADYTTQSFTPPAPVNNVGNSLASGTPYDQHTYVQSMILEISDAILCQLVGVDMINPQQGCLGINTVTHKIGYVPQQTLGTGGVLGFLTGSIAQMYVPPTHTSEYFNNLADNFGIVKKADAATDGFHALSPLLNLWKAARDISYLVFVIAFIFIGLGIMLRIKIDPRTVMNIQNQIPRVVIAILLITLSFAISGAMVDAMWIGTYVGINVITGTSQTNPKVGNTYLSDRATSNIFWTPVAYVNNLFDGGLGGLTSSISGAMGGILGDIVANTLGSGGGTCMSIIPPHFDFGACMGDLVAFIATIVLWVIIFCTLIILLFRVWFELLKAYMFILMYVVTGPLWIVASLLPGNPLGFGKWVKSLFVNLAVFPITAFMFVFARIITDLYNNNVNPSNNFIPPLVGNPNMKNFGVLGALGILLITPTMLSILRDAMKMPGLKQGAAIGAGLAAGAAVPGSIAGRQWAHLNRRNSMTGAGEGMISMATDRAKNKIMMGAGKIPGGVGKWIENARQREENRFEGNGHRTYAQLEARDPRYIRPDSKDTPNPTRHGYEQDAKGNLQMAPRSKENAQKRIQRTLRQNKKNAPDLKDIKPEDYGWKEIKDEKTGQGTGNYEAPKVSLSDAREQIKLDQQEEKINPAAKDSTPAELAPTPTTTTPTPAPAQPKTVAQLFNEEYILDPKGSGLYVKKSDPNNSLGISAEAARREIKKANPNAQDS